MLLLPTCKKETKARIGKVVRQVSLLEVTDHGVECRVDLDLYSSPKVLAEV